MPSRTLSCGPVSAHPFGSPASNTGMSCTTGRLRHAGSDVLCVMRTTDACARAVRCADREPKSDHRGDCRRQCGAQGPSLEASDLSAAGYLWPCLPPPSALAAPSKVGWSCAGMTLPGGSQCINPAKTDLKDNTQSYRPKFPDNQLSREHIYAEDIGIFRVWHGYCPMLPADRLPLSDRPAQRPCHELQKHSGHGDVAPVRMARRYIRAAGRAALKPSSAWR